MVANLVYLKNVSVVSVYSEFQYEVIFLIQPNIKTCKGYLFLNSILFKCLFLSKFK